MNYSTSTQILESPLHTSVKTVPNPDIFCVNHAFTGLPSSVNALSCQYRINSIDNSFQPVPKAVDLSTSHLKTSFTLYNSVQRLVDKYGANRIGFLTLTFADFLQCPIEAGKRNNSFFTNVLRPRYDAYLGCFERTKTGTIHYHYLIVMKQDIKSGFNFDEVADATNKNRATRYQSVSQYLKDEWSFLRSKVTKYGFGKIVELKPLKKDGEAIAKYISKYISKHIAQRRFEDKGVRLVRYSKGAKAGSNNFMFFTDGSALWRKKMSLFADIVQAKYPQETIQDLDDLSRVLGKYWAYQNRDFILNIKLKDEKYMNNSKPAHELIGKRLIAVEDCQETFSSWGDTFLFRKGSIINVISVGVCPEDSDNPETMIVFTVGGDSDLQEMYISHFTDYIEGDYYCSLTSSDAAAGRLGSVSH
jgi:hypothetical protein